jgi:hypothetical protein
MGDITLRQVFLQPLDLQVFPVILLVMAVCFILAMVYMQLRNDLTDLRWLIMDRPHRPSLNKIGQIVALAVSTWGFVVLTLSGKLTETYFIGYMIAWSGSAALDKYLNRGSRESNRERQDDPPTKE